MNVTDRRPEGSSHIVGALTTIVGLIIVVCVIIPILLERRGPSPGAMCLQHEKRILFSLRVYVDDWDETLPPTDRWADRVKDSDNHQMDNRVFKCATSTSPFGYELNAALGGRTMRSIARPESTVVLFEADATTINASGGEKDRIRTPRHDFSYSTGFADGHAVAVRGSMGLVWRP